MRCYEPWTCSRPIERIELSDFNTALKTTLRRSTPGDTELQLIMVRIYRGKDSTDPYMFYGADMRQKVMFILFDLLHYSELPMLIIGNFGMDTGSIFRNCQEYDLKKYHTQTCLKDRLQILNNSDQQLMCLSIRTPSGIMAQVEQEICPARIFAIKRDDLPATMRHAQETRPKQCRNKIQPIAHA